MLHSYIICGFTIAIPVLRFWPPSPVIDPRFKVTTHASISEDTCLPTITPLQITLFVLSNYGGQLFYNS